GDGGRQLQGAALHGRVADGRVRRHGARGRGEARLPAGARGGRGPRRADEALRGDRREDVRAREGRELRDLLRARRRHRPGGLAEVDHDGAPVGPAATAADAEEAAVRRYVVSDRRTGIGHRGAKSIQSSTGMSSRPTWSWNSKSAVTIVFRSCAPFRTACQSGWWRTFRSSTWYVPAFATA